MKKTIILNENTFNKIKRTIIKEALAPEFGKGKSLINYRPYLTSISKISNLHTDRYKDYELEEAYNNWKNTGYNKNGEDYLIYVSKFKRFMFGSSGLIQNISYTADRLGGPLHSILLDPKWVMSLNGKPNWKYSEQNSGYGGDEFHCFYTTVLKIFQNPSIWNDFFFNPIFSEAKQKYDSIRAKVTEAMKTNKEMYSQLLPMEEYKQLNLFMNEINQETKKVEKGINCKPELFFDGQIENIGDDSLDDEEY